MIAGTETARQPQISSEGANRVWLDAVATGICSAEVFLRAMHDQHHGNPDENWEVLSLLDQYYRRGKIKADLFQTLKTRLEGTAIGDEGAARMAARNPAASSELAAAAAALEATVPIVTPYAGVQAAAPPPTPTPTPAPTVIPTPRRPATVPHAASHTREANTGSLLRGRYRIGTAIGHGATGTVFEATDEFRVDLPSTSKRLAIKVLRPTVGQREDLMFEVQRGFQHLQLLSHPNIIRVHEFDRDGEIAFFTMELLNGAPLSRLLTSRNASELPRPYALAMMRDIGAALAHAHSIGVVHGDLNPHNVFIANDGSVRVLEFGTSHKLLREKWAADIELAQRAPVAAPGYASCQLLEGQTPDFRDDVFALACISYVLLAGQHPFPNRSAVEAYAQQFRPRRPPQLTGQQWRVLREGLRWERDRRPADVQQWLRRFGLAGAAPRLPTLSGLANAPASRGSRNLIVAGAVLAALALLAGGGYWAMTEHATDTGPAVAPPTDTAPGQEETPAPEQPVAPQAATPLPAPPPKPVPVPRAAVAPPPPTTNPARTPVRAQAPAQVQPPAPQAPARATATSGPVRVEMAADTIDVANGDTTAHITVRRRGNLHGDATFSWWTESGTAKPGTDFAAVTPRVDHIPDGSASVNLSIMLSGAPRSQPKSFYVVIDTTENPGTLMGAKNLTMVTLPASD